MVYRVQTVAPSVTVAVALLHLFLLAILALSVSSNADADADHRSTAAISPRAGSLFCRGAKRCRIFSVTMSTPVSSGGTCKEYCVLFPLLKPKLTCGSCPTNKGVVPVAAPVTAPTTAAAPAAVSGPASTPQVAPAPTPTGTIPVAVPNSAPVAKGAVPVVSTPTDANPIAAPLSRAPVPTGTVPAAATPTGTVPPILAPVPTGVTPVAAPKSTPVKTPSGGVPVAAPKAAPVPTPNVAAPVPKATPVVAPNAAPVVPTPTDSSFTIQLEMVDVPTADIRFYTTAKASWEKVVVGDLPDVVTTASSFPKYLTDEPFSRCVVPATIDDTYICVAYQNLGDGEAYGIGGPLFARYGLSGRRRLAGTTIYGNITINSAYQDGNSDFTGLATHEMGHVLGEATTLGAF
jgi:hypothetical protein